MVLFSKGILRCFNMDLLKIQPDKERAKNILSMTFLLEERIKLQNRKTMVALILADYYEITKEMITSVMLLDGYKPLSHKDLVEYLALHYPEVGSYTLALIDELRILRNRIVYDGFSIDQDFLQRKETSFKEVIKKLRAIVEKKLK